MGRLKVLQKNKIYNNQDEEAVIKLLNERNEEVTGRKKYEEERSW